MLENNVIKAVLDVAERVAKTKARINFLETEYTAHLMRADETNESIQQCRRTLATDFDTFNTLCTWDGI